MAGSDVGENGQAAGGPEPCTPLRLAAAAAWQVVRARQLGDFPRVLGLLEAVGQAAPDLVRFRHHARLRLGLQAAIVMGMLREGQPHGRIYEAVDTYFPEGDTQRHPLASARDLRLLAEAQESFRELVLELLRNPRRRETYLEAQLEAEYGEPFLGGLEGLIYEYLLRLESALPPPQLQQLQEAAWSESPLAGTLPRPPELRVLTHYLAAMGRPPHPGSPPQPLVSSSPSVAPPGAEQPAPRMPGSPQADAPPAHSLPPGEHHTEPCGAEVWESEAESEDSVPRRKVRRKGVAAQPGLRKWGALAAAFPQPCPPTPLGGSPPPTAQRQQPPGGAPQDFYW
ncbi:TERF1-interacting nuclear factor 2 isoform X2 [Carettochelys insculpta]|uniref:TERF1-interacting nuclear factor 2 isoform X2 n=1 Tax=Carettochelys insculpta TaxID=44489 RepID=UPI003EC10199